MPAPLSQDLRDRIRAGCGSSIQRAALRFDVSPSTAVKLMRRVREVVVRAPSTILRWLRRAGLTRKKRA